MIGSYTDRGFSYGHTIRDGSGSTTEHTGSVGFGNVLMTPEGFAQVQCPSCPTTSYYPLVGGAEAQELHAQLRYFGGGYASLDDARDAVANDVSAAGGTPLIGW